ncbi:hypothetical protein CDAR_59921 [Caerostris darwini]|uniref:Uncharacterized protein n=1 Tax=Caerostris darwini TaxID=1538125 RepID=A0AAV4RT29_9ARAC|nr:hypothetical protein CDAR_59921 [Caerostris darwini]
MQPVADWRSPVARGHPLQACTRLELGLGRTMSESASFLQDKVISPLPNLQSGGSSIHLVGRFVVIDLLDSLPIARLYSFMDHSYTQAHSPRQGGSTIQSGYVIITMY